MFFVPFCQMMLTFTSSKEISNTFSRTNRLVTLVTETQTMLNKKFKLYRMTHQQKSTDMKYEIYDFKLFT